MRQQKYLASIVILFLFWAAIACNSEEKSPIHYKTPEQIQQLKEPLLLANKHLVGKDKELIESYIQRHDWVMQMTETGLFYEIYKSAPESEKMVEVNDNVTINYKVSLLDGTLCYSSDSLGNKSFTTGKGGVELGLEEGVRLLRKGEKARLILPPHLAHGLLGDRNRIPPRSIIMYDIEIVDVVDIP